MGFRDWFNKKNKGYHTAKPFGDVPEEFGLGQDQAGGEEEAEKERCPRRQGRVQVNILVTPGTASGLRLTAKVYKCPISTAGEHVLNLGIAQMKEIAADPKQYKKMVDHLVHNHLLGTETRDSEDIRRLGWNPKKYERRYFHVSADARLLRLLSDCAKVVKTTIRELDNYQRLGNTFTLPLVRKMLLALLSEILSTLDRYSDAVKTPASMGVPGKPGVCPAQQEGTQSPSGQPSDTPGHDSDGDSGRVGFNRVEENGEFRDLPTMGRIGEE